MILLEMKMTSVLQQFRKQKYMIENTSIMIETYRNDISENSKYVKP